MSIARTVEPIKFGFLADMVYPDDLPIDVRNDMILPFELVFADGLAEGVIDRPVEIVYREVNGLPRGSVKAVIDAYAELVDEGCLAVFGPFISENTIPLREEIERRFRVPSISICGSDDWLGEWTFALPNGSMTDEPILWASLMAKAGQTSAGVLVERALIGQSYLKGFRAACRDEGIRIVAEESIPQTGQDIGEAVRRLHEAAPDAIVHCGFGLGVVQITEALRVGGLGPAPLHGHRVRGRVHQRRDLGPVRRLDRPRAVRRGQRSRPALHRPIRSGVRTSPRVLRAGGVPRRRGVVPRTRSRMRSRCHRGG